MELKFVMTRTQQTQMDVLQHALLLKMVGLVPLLLEESQFARQSAVLQILMLLELTLALMMTQLMGTDVIQIVKQNLVGYALLFLEVSQPV